MVYRLGHHLPFGPVALFLAFAWLTDFVTLPLAILLFPDGVLPARWRWVLWAYVAVSGFLLVTEYVAVVSLMIAHDVRIDASGGLAALDSRTGGTAWLSPVRAVIFPLLIVFWLSFIARLLLSWRRVSIEQRQRLKWLLTGCVITLASGVLSIVPVPAAFQSTVDLISDLGFVALPVCVGIAILKYRLYDIDRIISRTLAYAIVTGVLIGLYAGLVLLATRGLSFRAPVAVAASTLAAAGAVQSSAAAGSADRGPAVQSRPLRRRPDRGRFRGPAEGHRGPALSPGRPGHRRGPGPATRPRLCVDK